MDTFRVRLNCVDHYQATPTDLDPPLFGNNGSTQRSTAPQLSVVRVFGSTETGQKVCAHIHGALPYLYLEYRGSLEKDIVDGYIQQLRASIDHALAVSYRRNTYDGNAVYVAHISLVKGVPFFGYHVGYRHFLKVYMLNPLNMTRLADLMYQGVIMKQVLQPFEAHLQYIAQWMCDFNLYGCAYIETDIVRFRSPVPEQEILQNVSHRWHDQSIPPELILDPKDFPRLSHCSIEVDICVQDILNRQEVHAREIHHNFIERLPGANPDEKLVRSLAGLWKDETRRRKLRMGITDPSSSPFPPEVLVTVSADARNQDKSGWIHESEYRDLLHQLVLQESAQAGDSKVSFEDFERSDPKDHEIKTTLESVEDLFPENLKLLSQSWSDSTLERFTHSGEPNTQPLIDVSSMEEGVLDGAASDGKDSAKNGSSRSEVASQEEDFNHEYGPSSVGLHAHKLDQARNGKMNGRPFESSSQEEDLHYSGDECEQQRSVKKRKLDETLSHPEETAERRSKRGPDNGSFTDGKKVVSFRDSLDGSNGISDQVSNDEKKLENGTPTNSQLSQTSIKAQNLNGEISSGFKTKKASQELEDAKSRSFSGDSPKTPVRQMKANQSQTKDTTPVTPWSDSLTTKTPISPSPEIISKISKLAVKSRECFSQDAPRTHLWFGRQPPTHRTVEINIQNFGLPPVIYQDAYYSNDNDVPERARDYAGREFKLEGCSAPFLPVFDPTASDPANFDERSPTTLDREKQRAHFEKLRTSSRLRNWEIAKPPPSYRDVETWEKASRHTGQRKKSRQSEQANGDKTDSFEKREIRHPRIAALSQIDGPTQKNSHGFKYSPKKKSTSVQHETQYMSVISLEVHVNTRETFVPNPEQDEVSCIFWCVKADEGESPDGQSQRGGRTGVLLLKDDNVSARDIARDTKAEVEEMDTELDLLNRMIDILRDLDPDILTGFEVHNGSWGYLIERGRLKYDFDLCDEFSRMKSLSHGRFGKEADRWGFETTTTIRVTGRHMINIWRAMRGELNLLQYTLENIVFHLLHKRIPHYTFKDLTQWYKSRKSRDILKTINYFLSRAEINIAILEANELVPRTSEQARLIGVDFFSVFSRGSQFKVESFMFRIAKPENFLLVSPSKKQVGQQNALECLPLVMEPQSAFYSSPLLVLDFQSLYPSVMIAYNYCYSTCLGRVVGWRGRNKLGFADYQRQPRILELVQNYVNIAPNGIMYVKPEMRKSLLAKMLCEILETRVMVKSGMKVDKDDKTLQQLLNNRQLALKLLANVTYGYTSASFSGRMPCSEIADSIVQTARETLERTVAYIHSIKRWGAEVVYGDTDSLFVYLKGKTRDQAFDIGNEIVEAVTDQNPRPVKLKFEKVYHPCVLLAKKRYVGFKYEYKNQTEPEFDAKGIETVRRDGNPAEQKIEEKALKILFRTSDLSQVKSYFQQQCSKIMRGKVSVQDFCFAREVRLGTYSDKGPPPPGALISTRRMLADPRLEPQYGERVPYVVITGAPGARLIDRCVAPEQLLREEAGELDAEYYISKTLIPPLERIFNLVGANVRLWYDEMPKIHRIRDLDIGSALEPANQQQGALQSHGMSKKTLESYMKSSHCLVCRVKLDPPSKDARSGSRPATPRRQTALCDDCLRDASSSIYTLSRRYFGTQKKMQQLETVCRDCAHLSGGEEVKCDSQDCPVYYSRVKNRAKEARLKRLLDNVTTALERDEIEW